MPVTWTIEEVVALIALAIGVVAAIAGILAVNNVRTRLALFALLTVTLVASFLITQRITIVGSVSERFTQADADAEARREIALETQRRAQAMREARARVERELREQAEAEKAARELITREEAENEARRLIAREQAVREARERIEREAAQRAANLQQAADAERLRHAQDLIIGRWSSWRFPQLEFTRDGQILKAASPDSRYRFVTPDSIEERNWCCKFGVKILVASPDSFVLRWYGSPMTIRRL